MPNHVTTVCTVSGPARDVLLFVENHIRSRRGEGMHEGKTLRIFDFETVAPMPDVVKGTESSSDAEHDRDQAEKQLHFARAVVEAARDIGDHTLETEQRVTSAIAAYDATKEACRG